MFESSSEIVKEILNRDESNSLSAKAKYELLKKIKVANDQVRKLLEVKILASKKEKELQNRYKALKEKNAALTETLKKKLE